MPAVSTSGTGNMSIADRSRRGGPGDHRSVLLNQFVLAVIALYSPRKLPSTLDAVVRLYLALPLQRTDSRVRYPWMSVKFERG